jgi:hypothetical protein
VPWQHQGLYGKAYLCKAAVILSLPQKFDVETTWHLRFDYQKLTQINEC